MIFDGISCVMEKNKSSYLSVFQLSMMATIAVVSLRNVPLIASFGASFIFYMVLSSVLFLVPSAMISSFLAENLTDNRGIFSWVNASLGPSFGFLAVWLQWMSNLFWFPLILTHSLAILTYKLSFKFALGSWVFHMSDAMNENEYKLFQSCSYG